MDKDELKPVVESLIFASDEPVSLERLTNIIEGAGRKEVREAVEELAGEYAERAGGIYIEEVAGGYQFRTSPDHAPWLRRLLKIGPKRISKAAMEALAIIAYKQPVTRAEVEAIRGVDSGGVVATLMDKRFIKIVGRKEVPGRPVVYGTTPEFLETFDLDDLSCLPSLRDIRSLEEEYAAEEEAEEGLPEGGGETAPGIEEDHDEGRVEARPDDPEDLGWEGEGPAPERTEARAETGDEAEDEEDLREEAAEEDPVEGDGAPEASEDSGPLGGDLEEEGGGDDPRGESEGELPGGDRAGNEG